MDILDLNISRDALEIGGFGTLSEDITSTSTVKYANSANIAKIDSIAAEYSDRPRWFSSGDACLDRTICTRWSVSACLADVAAFSSGTSGFKIS